MVSVPSQKILDLLNVRDAEPVATTAIASVWRVRRVDDSYAALKIYHEGDTKNEAPGLAFLKALHGQSAAEIYDDIDGAVLLEWLEGPSLGDLTRSGNDVEACQILVDIANAIHQIKIENPLELPKLEDWFESLFQLRFADDCPDDVKAMIDAARRIAKELLASQIEVRPLHGDLHHDNIRLGARGYCAFDAKGVLGERAYELANAFRNPKGAETLVRDPIRISRIADLWAQDFHIDRLRLLKWAAAKAALSIAWRYDRWPKNDKEYDLLQALLKAAGYKC